jgi:hypothetical protein
MPNWCTNVATINHGSTELIDAIETELKKEEPQLFQMLRPRPPEFDEGDSWYMWNVENWGTKWEASIYDYERVDANNIKITFDTAWGAPIAFYDYIFGEGYDTTAFYDECGMAFCGKYEFGSNDHYEYGDMDSAQVKEQLPEELDDMFSISQQMEERELEDDDFDSDDEEDEVEEPTYEVTDWFPKKIKPVRVGTYEIMTDSWPFPQKCEWSGEQWENAGGALITQWRGITEHQNQLIVALEELKKEFDELMSKEETE